MALSLLASILTASAEPTVRETFTPQAGIKVLDMTSRNTTESETTGDYSRQLYSATYMCDIAGNPYAVTADLDEALKGAVLLLSSDITKESFTADELQRLTDWVKEGGVLLSPEIRTTTAETRPLLSELFGIAADSLTAHTSSHRLINWSAEFAMDTELSYFDEEEEKETSIGEIRTQVLPATTADVLATYAGGGAAVTRNTLGKGCAYLVGLTWRNVIQRNQLNKDVSASRRYNNGFEPSADIWPLFLRSVYAKAVDVAAWKFTVPAGYLQVLVPTHDCDSRTAYEAMHYMGDYEKSLGLHGHYFFTTHYYSDKENFGGSYLSAFYNAETIPYAAALLAEGHTGGSHSVCHFPDFNKCTNTDVVTREEYAHRATCVDGVSTGASTWAELILSKQILEEDLGRPVRSFRSGHLCVNADFNRVLEEGGYEFASCYTAGDLLSEFPFFGRMDNAWGGAQTKVLQIPLHISDVYNGNSLSNDNWETHVASADWRTAMRKLRGNYASAVLLIHPNREWKMTLEQRLVDSLDLTQVGLYNFEDYGDFWKARFATDFRYSYNADTKQLTVVTDLAAVDDAMLTFAVDCAAEVESAVICDTTFTEVRPCTLKPIAPQRYLLMPSSFYSGIEILPAESEADQSLRLKPVGAPGRLRIEGKGPFRLYDLTGECVMVVADNLTVRTADLSSLPPGCYIISSETTGASIKLNLTK
jgi:hypothetical protein